MVGRHSVEPQTRVCGTQAGVEFPPLSCASPFGAKLYYGYATVREIAAHALLLGALLLASSSRAAQFLNIIARGFVAPNDHALIGGFILNGAAKKQILVRGIGPSLASAGLSDVLTGATPAVTRNDLTYQDETGSGEQTNTGYKWLEKSYDFNVLSAADVAFYVDVGVWGTWETYRAYYIDNVRITVTEN